MTGFYIPAKCIQRTDIEHRLYHDLSPSQFQERHKCESCTEYNGEKDCYITLERLFKIYYSMDDELKDELEGNLI